MYIIYFSAVLNNLFAIDTRVQSMSISVDCIDHIGNVLGPLEFISYTEDVVDVFTYNLVCHHLFADDNQLYQSGIASFCHQLCHYVTDLRDWCSSR